MKTKTTSKYTYGDAVYIKPYCRIAPYLVGMALGYILHQQNKSKPRMKLVGTMRPWTLINPFTPELKKHILPSF